MDWNATISATTIVGYPPKYTGLHPFPAIYVEVTPPRAAAQKFTVSRDLPSDGENEKGIPRQSCGEIPRKTTLQGTDTNIPLLKAPFGSMNFPNFPFWLGYVMLVPWRPPGKTVERCCYLVRDGLVVGSIGRRVIRFWRRFYFVVFVTNEISRSKGAEHVES